MLGGWVHSPMFRRACDNDDDNNNDENDGDDYVDNDNNLADRFFFRCNVNG